MDPKPMISTRARLSQLAIDECMCLAVFAGFASAFHDDVPLVSLSFVIVVLYLLDGLLPSPSWRWRAKFFLLAAAIGIFVFGLGAVQILERHITAPYLFVHDGLIQTEEATKFLLEGKDPYGADYSLTPMANWDFRLGDLTRNPALHHNAYLPFLFLFTAPFYLILYATLGWFDGRMLFLPLLVGVLLILARWVKDKNARYGLMLFVSLNPAFLPYLIQGRNDIFILFWVVLGVELMRRGRERLSLVVLGIACASKLTAWFFIPFYLLFLLKPNPDELLTWLRVKTLPSLRRMLPLAMTVGFILLPFLLWQPAAFIDDTWNYPNGTSAFAPYPVSGLGFNVLAQGLGWLPRDAIRSPFEILQWIIGLPVLGWLAWRQVKLNSLPNMWFSYAVALSVISFFSHVLNDNHVGYILTLFAISAITDDGKPPPEGVDSHGH